MARFDPDNYVSVAARITAFITKYPKGSLQSEVLVNDGQRVLMRGAAYRHPDDNRPGVGHAEEMRITQTMVDKAVSRDDKRRLMSMPNYSSPIENCETSAFGRAIASLGFEVDRQIASQEEMRKVERMIANGGERAKTAKPKLS